MKKLLMTAIAGSALLAFGAFAQNTSSPVGLWKNIDDHSGKPKALIRISESNGELHGKIEKLLRDPGQDQNPKCVKCTGELKDQPILGMTIISGMKQDGSEYNGGQILDPDNGKFYKSKMSLTDHGRKLSVRGYIGVPLLGRTQVWIREE
jgi:uncharacterized protein (DUF2147 family)